MAPRMKTIEQLESELQMRKREVDKLQSQRGDIVARLTQIDRQIALLTGKEGPRVAAAPAAKPGRRARGKSLIEALKEVLRKNPKGMRVKELTQAVQKAGYQTASKDFYGIVAATLRDKKHFQRIARGVYKAKD